MSVNVRDGYLFGYTDSRGAVSDSLLLVIANHLTSHLQTLGIPEGESMRSLRSGCFITMVGASRCTQGCQ